MKRWLRPVAVSAACLFVFLTSGARLYEHYFPERSVASPTHVVNVYLDGLNHLDFRAACSVIHAPIAFPTQAKCESYFAFYAQMTGPIVEKVVPHSAKVWTQKYTRRYNCAWVTYPDGKLRLCTKTKTTHLRLAVVKYTANGQVLTAHLRLIHGQWRIWGVTS